VIERASSADLAFLAMDTGYVPEQFAVILILERSGDFSLSQLRQLISDRILALPRLRQRLRQVPPGCGRPVWVDDADFNVDRHVRAVSCQAPRDERALLDTALTVIMDPLPREAPLWSIVLLTDLDGGVAVVVVLHHVLADGLGGLNVLAALVDPGLSPADVPLPKSFADTGKPRSRCVADAAPGGASGGLVLAVPAPGNVRGWRLSPSPRRPMLACATDGSASKHGCYQSGSRFAACSSTPEWRYDERCCSGRCGCRATSVFAEQRRVRRSDCHHRSRLRPPVGRQTGCGQPSEPDARPRPHKRQYWQTP
jgi:hypothetical protein